MVGTPFPDEITIADVAELAGIARDEVLQALVNANATIAAKIEHIRVRWHSELIFLVGLESTAPQSSEIQLLSGAASVPGGYAVAGNPEADEFDFCGWVRLERSASEDLVHQGRALMMDFDSYGVLPNKPHLPRRRGNAIGAKPLELEILGAPGAHYVLREYSYATYENTYASIQTVRSVAVANKAWRLSGRLLADDGIATIPTARKRKQRTGASSQDDAKCIRALVDSLRQAAKDVLLYREAAIKRAPPATNSIFLALYAGLTRAGGKAPSAAKFAARVMEQQGLKAGHSLETFRKPIQLAFRENGEDAEDDAPD